MRAMFACLLCLTFVFTGCENSGETLNKALSLRSQILARDGCSFNATVTADYGEQLYVFSLDCQTDKDGNLTFTVAAPETIAGITGKITDSGTSLTFDDKVLAFPAMADGQVTPVTAPWIFMKTLRSGYLNDCTDWENGYQISIDDTYQSDALHLNILVNADNLPISGEIIWQNRRMLTLTVKDFAFL